ncbi:MAG: purine-binding chemotaxis protein CheW [Deltaproteobacteria bacterium]|nr:purine-binding chemotaxis protein CheW [Deltaproteobacteria bacterium]MBI3755135.1 purine-binding chemotaxis protein CheW [Deltaproteobacteria bacterium]
MRQDAAQTPSPSIDVQLICLKLGTEEYGLGIMQIKEVIRYQKIVPLPKAPLFIEGVINLRGMAIPIIDLRKRFNLSADVNPSTKIIIAQVENRIIGLVVDDVTDIITLHKDSLLPPPEMIKGVEAEYLDGIVNIGGEGLLFIINLDRVLTGKEKGLLEVSL